MLQEDVIQLSKQIVSQLTLDEKVKLLAGADAWSTLAVKRLGIPSITFSDGPHGVRGTKFFNAAPACLLPSATAMGATFDEDLLWKIGDLLGVEAIRKKVNGLLAPTVCIQRSPLIGRGFEAFGEDPTLSGILAAAYVSGLQAHHVGAVIKHFAGHDQSYMSTEDSIRVSERTLREVHLLPFQIAIKHSNPWGVMTSYNKINGVHASEDKFLLEDVLRRDWGWQGMTMCDWAGIYSTAESINAGLDLEMPGPSRWRGPLLSWLITSRKVNEATIDARAENILSFVRQTEDNVRPSRSQPDDDPHGRAVCRKAAAESIVLLKNSKEVLPLKDFRDKKFGLIGTHFTRPAVSGGGSADLTPYYVSTPYDAVIGILGEKNVEYEMGCYTHRFSPLLKEGLVSPSQQPGWLLEWFAEEPNDRATCLASTTTLESYMFFPDSIPEKVPDRWYLRVRSTFRAKKSMTFRFGVCVAGLATMSINGVPKIDLWSSQPEKTSDTPMFNTASMEKFADVETTAGKAYHLEILMTNDALETPVGAAPVGGLRVGGFELVDEDVAIQNAVQLAKRVDIPILIAGLSSDWEFEAADRDNLDLPGRTNELIERVISANPHTIVITQSGMPITMPWIQHTNTLLHAWFGGQETGHGLTDVLFGHTNPSGRLPITFPQRLEDTPAFLTFGKADCEIYYGEGVFVGHRYYEKTLRQPLFYFGYGLSYTQFEYSNLKVPKAFLSSIEISVDLQNIGSTAGAEVVQVYIADLKSSVARPVRELKAFRKVFLETNEKRTVTLLLDKYAVSFWSERISSWVAEAGEFDVIIAKSADPADELCRTRFTLANTFAWTGL